jgi:hypothetical protein
MPAYTYKTDTAPSGWGGSLDPEGSLERWINREAVNGWELVSAVQILPGYSSGEVGLIWRKEVAADDA